MTELLGSEALPGRLPRLLEAWARALVYADVPTRHWVREASEIGATQLAAWVEITASIENASIAARLASVRLADVLDARDRANDQSAKTRAHVAFKQLVAELHHARPTRGKVALGLGW